MNDSKLYAMYSTEAMERIQTPGGYQHLAATDEATGRSMWLEETDVPLGLAGVILEAHSQARAGERHLVSAWEQTLEDLCDDLYVRCDELEQRLRERR